MNVTLHIVEAANLNLVGMMKSLPDPYCKVIIGNRRQKTSFLKKTVNPRWDHRFVFENVSPQTPVHIEVRDHSLLKKDRMIGLIETDLQKLLSNPISWWPLVGREGSGGTLYIDAQNNNLQNQPFGMGMGMGSTIPQQGMGMGMGSTIPQQGMGLGSTIPQQGMGMGSTISQGSFAPQGQGITGLSSGVGNDTTTHKHHGLSSILHPTEMLHSGSTTNPQQGISSFPQQGMGSTIPQQGMGMGSSFPQQGMGSTIPQQGMGMGTSIPQQGMGMGSSFPQQTMGMGTTVPQQGTTGTGETHIHIHKN